MTTSAIGQATGGKPIALAQLQAELETAGVDCSTGLGLSDDAVYTYDAAGQAVDFPTEAQATVDQVIGDHVAMRDKTDAEYATEFQNPATTVARKQEIRDITAGLLPREQVPMEAPPP
jgi:hypothetical protein